MPSLTILCAMQNSCVEVLTSTVAEFGVKIQTGLNEVRRLGTQSDRISVLIRRDSRELIHIFSHCSPQSSPLSHENTLKKVHVRT
jgi:hypothetical protein